MSSPDLARERAAEHIADRNAFLVVAAILAASVLVNALSIGTENVREGGGLHAAAPWILEGTSNGMTLVLFPAILWLTRRAPVGAESGIEGWRAWLPAHVFASVAFSATHVAGMVALRKLAYPPIVGEAYIFTDNLVRDFIYEYRKDAFSYAVLVGVIVTSRHLAQQRREAQAAREDARATGRLTLKCGGRTMWVEASDVAWAKAASNYVEVRAGERTLLARATLAAVERQLADAGTSVARVHRSYLVNADQVAEIAPTGEGDARIVMRDGEVIPASRRYREAWPGS